MKIEITKYEMNVSDADEIVELVNGEFETKKWSLEIWYNMPRFFSTDDKDYWEIEFDMYSKEWKLYYDYEEVGVVMFEDDNDILWNFK